jgi:tRNA (guanine37-N1)-methyltransferase
MPHYPANDGRPPWRATVLTLFPELFPGPLGASLAGRALESGLWSLRAIQIRDFGIGRHRQVDDTPAGGGAGMVLRADVLGRAADHVREEDPHSPMICLTPRGTPFRQGMAHELAAGPGVILVAGRFEGIDERVIKARAMREVSIGDYVLSAGDIAAMALLDAAVRLLPGVAGTPRSIVEESFEHGLLEHPQYTRPRVWEGLEIPEPLLSGDHAKIGAWREREARRATAERRPDLLGPDLPGPDLLGEDAPKK